MWPLSWFVGIHGENPFQQVLRNNPILRLSCRNFWLLMSFKGWHPRSNAGRATWGLWSSSRRCPWTHSWIWIQSSPNAPKDEILPQREPSMLTVWGKRVSNVNSEGLPCGSISSMGALGVAWIWIWECVRRRRRRRRHLEIWDFSKPKCFTGIWERGPWHISDFQKPMCLRELIGKWNQKTVPTLKFLQCHDPFVQNELILT